MDALLILGGLLMILIGLVWLVMRAFSVSLLWGWAAALPPLTLLFLVCHWARARQAVVLCALGLIPLIVGLSITANEDPQRFEAILALQWLQPQKSKSALEIQLNGQLNGKPFVPLEAEFVDGTLRLSEGADSFARRELLIRGLPIADQTLRADVLPTDTGPLPVVEFSWLLPDQELPEARQLAAGYTLHLDLKPMGADQLAGDLHLVLPPQFQTTLSGRVQVFRNGLRYQNGAIDRRVDSRDTLTFVIDDYLQRRFATRDVRLAPLPVLSFPASTLSLEVRADVDGQAQRLTLGLTKSADAGWRVDDDNYAALPAPGAGAPVEKTKPAATAEPAVAAIAPEAFSLLTLLGDPQLYVNRSLRIVNDQGGSVQGRFVELDGEGLIVLRQRLNGSGEASFAIDPNHVSQIELLAP